MADPSPKAANSAGSVPGAMLRPREERRLIRGHCWAYRNEFSQLPKVSDGDVVDVYTSGKRFVGRGFFQATGGIAVRLCVRHQVPLDDAWLHESLRHALGLRQALFCNDTTYRWVFGESDALPGLVIDRYGSLAVVATSCAFYAQRAEAIAAALREFGGIQGVLWRGSGPNTSDARSFGMVPESLRAEWNYLSFEVPVAGAQKTGLFLDQRWNARWAERLAEGRRVLDGHCHAGNWSLHAARGGATAVLGVDTSAAAIESAQANADRNGLAERCRFERNEVEALLEEDAEYGLVVLDPPAFAKTRSQSGGAIKRYQALNQRAIERIEPGGYLITSSCSHFVDDAMFYDLLKRAGQNARRNLALLALEGAAPDHPVLLAMPETAYLVCAVLRVT